MNNVDTIIEKIEEFATKGTVNLLECIRPMFYTRTLPDNILEPKRIKSGWSFRKKLQVGDYFNDLDGEFQYSDYVNIYGDMTSDEAIQYAVNKLNFILLSNKETKKILNALSKYIVLGFKLGEGHPLNHIYQVALRSNEKNENWNNVVKMSNLKLKETISDLKKETHNSLEDKNVYIVFF